VAPAAATGRLASLSKSAFIGLPINIPREHPMTAVSLTPAQRAILEQAVRRAEGRIDWFPPTIHGGARLKVLASLAKRGLAKPVRKQWTVTDAGRAALGDDGAAVSADPAMEAAVASAEASVAANDVPRAPRTREHSKQAEVLRMLRRPEGATISQICVSTGWQAHTVRGTFAGAFKKKLGLVLTSEKVEGAERVYRVA